jgi:Mannosyltransferase (PIG-V)
MSVVGDDLRPVSALTDALRRDRYALWTYAWSRVVLWVAVAFAYLLFGSLVLSPRADGGWLLELWVRADAGWYLKIVQDGYAAGDQSTAFFPLYPLLVRLVSGLLGGVDVPAALVVTAGAGATAFVLLHRLTRELLGEDDARRAVLLLAVYPATLFLGAVYSEALYLALSIAAFQLARRERWVWAGVVTGLAMLTRTAGVALVPALAVLAWRSGSRRRALAGLAAAFGVAAVWPLYLWRTFGHPLQFLTAQREGWGRDVSPAGPLAGLWHAGDATWAALRQVAAGPFATVNYWPHATDYRPSFYAAVNLEEAAFTLLLIGLGVVAWRLLGAAYGLFVLVSLAIPLSSPTEDFPLLSMPRFGLGVFPVFIALAHLSRRERVAPFVLGTSAVLCGVGVVRWALDVWLS